MKRRMWRYKGWDQKWCQHSFSPEHILSFKSGALSGSGSDYTQGWWIYPIFWQGPFHSLPRAALSGPDGEITARAQCSLLQHLNMLKEGKVDDRGDKKEESEILMKCRQCVIKWKIETERQGGEGGEGAERDKVREWKRQTDTSG